MEARMNADCYGSWRGLKGKVIEVIPYGNKGYLGSIASANAQGATDDLQAGGVKIGYRFLTFLDVTILEK